MGFYLTTENDKRCWRENPTSQVSTILAPPPLSSHLHEKDNPKKKFIYNPVPEELEDKSKSFKLNAPRPTHSCGKGGGSWVPEWAAGAWAPRARRPSASGRPAVGPTSRSPRLERPLSPPRCAVLPLHATWGGKVTFREGLRWGRWGTQTGPRTRGGQRPKEKNGGRG